MIKNANDTIVTATHMTLRTVRTGPNRMRGTVLHEEFSFRRSDIVFFRLAGMYGRAPTDPYQPRAVRITPVRTPAATGRLGARSRRQ